MHRKHIFAMSAVLAASPCWASLIPQGPATFPAGIGSSTTVLTINTDSGGSGSGCVGFISVVDVTGLGACPEGFTGAGGDEATMPGQTATRTMAQLSAAGVSTASGLVVFVQPANASTGTLSVQDLALIFFDPANDTTFTANVAGAPLSLAPATAAPGRVAGFAFALDSFEAGLSSSFFSNAANRAGAAITLNGAGEGAARVFIAPASGPASATPEPATVGMTGVTLAAIAAKLRCRGAARLKRSRSRGRR